MNAERRTMPLSEALPLALGDIAGLDVVDLGCGTGRVTRDLAHMGANVTGVEPNPKALETARELGRAEYHAASAEQTGLDDDLFDVAVFSLSLHHVPDKKQALREACRLVREGGRILVAEPEAPDPIWPVMRFIDDESEVYAEAQAAIEALEAERRLKREKTLKLVDNYRAETPEDMIDDLISVDGDRCLDPADRPAFERAFAESHQRDDEGGYIPYWLRLDILRV